MFDFRGLKYHGMAYQNTSFNLIKKTCSLYNENVLCLGNLWWKLISTPVKSIHGLESLIHSIGLKLFLVKRVVSSEFGGKGVRICSFWLHSFAFSKLEHSKVFQIGTFESFQNAFPLFQFLEKGNFQYSKVWRKQIDETLQ